MSAPPPAPARAGTAFPQGAPAGAWARLRPAAGPAFVLALAVFTLASMPAIASGVPEYRAPGAPAYALILLAALANLARARWPVPAALLAGAAVGGYLALSYPYGTIFGFVVLTIYTVARRRVLRVAVTVAIATLVLLLLHVPINDAALPGAVAVLPALAWVAIPLTVGVARRLVVQAGRRERAEADRRLLAAERLRLSQEVHDVVGHGLAAIQMQADITLHVDDSDPGRMRAALTAISDASSQALDELRSTLAAIRDQDDTPRDRAPTPGLARAEELCRRVEEAGVGVDLAVEGRPQPLDAAADVAAYRVLQESLTNVVKHSAHQHAAVRIRHTTHAVTLEVTNQDLSPAAAQGVGISGMRRRVTQLGGTFRAGRGPSPGTFQVRAALPREDSSP